MQSSFVKALLPVQHNRLIKVMRVYMLLFKEPMMDRKQCRFPAHFSLICHTTYHKRCQCCDGWTAKQILHIQLVACLERTGYDLNRLDGIAAQIKEIVQNTYSWHAQGRLPDRHECPFRRGMGRFIIRSALLTAFRCWQGLAVDFTVRCQRHLLQLNEIRRHHIAW
ncbi:hypothetical protein D1872_92050 [compost metagenome]